MNLLKKKISWSKKKKKKNHSIHYLDTMSSQWSLLQFAELIARSEMGRDYLIVSVLTLECVKVCYAS